MREQQKKIKGTSISLANATSSQKASLSNIFHCSEVQVSFDVFLLIPLIPRVISEFRRQSQSLLELHSGLTDQL